MSEDRLLKKIQDLENQIKKYEENGVAKLYYSLNRKSWEMADLMNSISLKDIDIDAAQSKTFDRLKVIWQDAADIAIAVKNLGESAGITGEEKKDVAKKGSFLDNIVS